MPSCSGRAFPRSVAEQGDWLRKALRVSAALAGASILLWIGLCGPLAQAFDPPDVGAPDYGPTGPFGQLGVFFFMAALVLVPVTILLLLAWLVRAAFRKP